MTSIKYHNHNLEFTLPSQKLEVYARKGFFI
jgi:hypothetical protein